MLALALVLLLPSSAFAGSLLSGYGGPGSGAQAILGSTLIGGGGGAGGGSGRGGSTGGSGSSSGASSSTGGGSPAGVGVYSTGQGRGGNGAGSGSRAGGAARASGVGTSGGASPTYSSSGQQRAGDTLASSRDAGALGLSGADLLLIALAVGVLVITAGLTRRLARMQH
jgi:hypothetical protein